MSKVSVEIVTNHGNITIEVDDASAPKTVANFLSYVDDGFYDGTVFHRVIPGFMLQGGGFDPTLTRKPTKDPVKNEADNRVINDIGTVAMARTNDPHSATAQFFINVAKNDFLNHSAKSSRGWGYCVFGKVTDGMETVKAIEAVPTGKQNGMGDVPKEQVSIESVRRKG